MSRVMHKVVEIPTTATAAQIENALDNKGAEGWFLVQVFVLGTKTFAVFRKEIL